MGYATSRFGHSVLLSAACVRPARILAISAFSTVSMVSIISAIWVKFRLLTDTKDSKTWMPWGPVEPRPGRLNERGKPMITDVDGETKGSKSGS